MANCSGHYHRFLVQLHKRDLSKLTFLVEAYEGMASYTTLSFRQHDWHRTVELIVPNGWEDVMIEVLEELKKEISPLNVERKQDPYLNKKCSHM